MKTDPNDYGIHIERIVEDGTVSYKATVAELPHLTTYEETAQAALEVMIEDISALQRLALEHGHRFPPPGATRI